MYNSGSVSTTKIQNTQQEIGLQQKVLSKINVWTAHQSFRRSKDATTLQKTVAISLRITIMSLYWIIFYPYNKISPFSLSSAIFISNSNSNSQNSRILSLLIMESLTVFPRHVLWLFVLVPYSIHWGFAIWFVFINSLLDFVLLFFTLIPHLFIVDNTDINNGIIYTAWGLVIIGLILENISELQRWWFKRKHNNYNSNDIVNHDGSNTSTANKENEKNEVPILYTQGLFKYAININYFGFLLRYFGMALITGTIYAIVYILIIFIPLFVFSEIPSKAVYMNNRYGQQWQEYQKHTKKLVPCVW